MIGSSAQESVQRIPDDRLAAILSFLKAKIFAPHLVWVDL